MLQSSDDETAVTDPPTEEDAVEQAPDEQATAPRRFQRLRRRRLLSRFSIQSKLVADDGAVGTVIAAAVVGFIAYHAGRSSMRTQVFSRLTELRESQLRALTTEFNDLKNSLIIYSHGAVARSRRFRRSRPASISLPTRRSIPGSSSP